MIRRISIAGALLVVCLPAAAHSQGVAIEHKEVGCIVVGKYPKMNACFTPVGEVARSRVYFRPEGTPSWYYVDMKSDQPCFSGILPRPGKKLVGKKIEYYVEAQDKTFNPARTAEYGPTVVRSAQECKKQLPVAPFLNNASVAVFPGLPAGFVGGGIGTAAVVGVAAAGAAAAGTVAVVASNNNDNTTTTVVSSVNTTTTIVAATTTTTTTTTLPPASNRAPFSVLTTNPDPASGQTPLTVTFDLCKSTDPDGDALSYFFDFGDGAKAAGACQQSHTYTTTFREASSGPKAQDASFTATARVTDPGGLSHERTRPIHVGSPPPQQQCDTSLVFRPPATADCQTRFTVRVDTTDVDTVRFCANPCSRFAADAAPLDCAPGRGPSGSGNTFTATFDLDVTGCIDVTADATGCGGSPSAKQSFFIPCAFQATAAPRAEGRSGEWSSELELEDGRIQLAVNGGEPAFASRGRAGATARLVEGTNRIEAVVVESAGKPGLWRVTLAPPDAIVEGSLRVLSGEAVTVGATTATFRLTGNAGERIAFTFVRK
jgi:hypothetical protein